MADYAALIQSLVGNAYNNILAPGGLTETVTLRFFVSNGVYDAENDTTNPVYNDIPGIIAVAAKPTFEDVRDHNVVFTSTKLIIQGVDVPQEFNTETDKVVRMIGPPGAQTQQVWSVSKDVGVPGRGIYIVFVART